MSDLTPNEVLRTPTIYCIHSGEWMGGWPDESQSPEDAMDDLKSQLLACREALSGLHYAHSQIVGGEVVHPSLNVPHLWDRVRACLPEYDKEEE